MAASGLVLQKDAFDETRAPVPSPNPQVLGIHMFESSLESYCA